VTITNTDLGDLSTQFTTNNELAGDIGVCIRSPGHVAEIGFTFAPSSQGRGYATETTHALAGSAFTQDVDEVFAVVMPGAGIDIANIVTIRTVTRAREFHASAKRQMPSLSIFTLKLSR